MQEGMGAAGEMDAQPPEIEPRLSHHLLEGARCGIYMETREQPAEPPPLPFGELLSQARGMQAPPEQVREREARLPSEKRHVFGGDEGREGITAGRQARN